MIQHVISVVKERSEIFMRKIRELREAQGLSQRDLAYRVGVSLPAIQRLENEEGDPKWSTVERTADELKTSTDYMMGRHMESLNLKKRFSKEELDLIIRFLDDMRKLHTPET